MFTHLKKSFNRYNKTLNLNLDRSLRLPHRQVRQRRALQQRVYRHPRQANVDGHLGHEARQPG
jgi:hypothetical protein